MNGIGNERNIILSIEAKNALCSMIKFGKTHILGVSVTLNIAQFSCLFDKAGVTNSSACEVQDVMLSGKGRETVQSNGIHRRYILLKSSQ
jgi:hypothetical protein